MRIREIIVISLGMVFLCGSCTSASEKAWQFDGGISRPVLENYLGRAVTMAEFLTVDPFCNDGAYPNKEDDIRLIKNTGAKFIGRSIYRWGGEQVLNDPAFWRGARQLIEKVHTFDKDVIFQAGTFEAVTREVNLLKIPDWVFIALGLPVEERNFSYEMMLNPEGKYVGLWGEGSSVPDITRVETQLWFMYLIGSYIQIGCEAVHLGQVALIGMNDPDFETWQSFLKKVRDYARQHARRHWVLFDAHTPSGGMLAGEVSLLDFNSFPLRIKEIPEKPMEGMLEMGHLDALYGRSLGCITPSGWSCEALPYLVEFDNFGISDHPGVANVKDHYVWGYDEITWFYLQSSAYRQQWLKYAYDWLRENDPNGHLEMPVARVISTGNSADPKTCRGNTPSEKCPQGMGVEETIKTLWNRK
ncbi:hypothetical protein [uncultured Odoribacter sp.]|uniref:hypothetical protein n=1 Tax=uncultured Odoribacter sp. TaxID=876416 RepID=UPI002624439E|nr:hypothetical protein [uncultured Odoribacter sp.]